MCIEFILMLVKMCDRGVPANHDELRDIGVSQPPQDVDFFSDLFKYEVASP